KIFDPLKIKYFLGKSFKRWKDVAKKIFIKTVEKRSTSFRHEQFQNHKPQTQNLKPSSFVFSSNSNTFAVILGRLLTTAQFTFQITNYQSTN
ncbi:MAG: hypothetical protein ACTHMM_19575, partial [Agriterribacter sp.]